MWFELKGDERLKRCESEGCFGQQTWRLEADGIGTNYCSGCRANIIHQETERAIRGPSPSISERGQALILAAAVLDRPNADPDDDIAILARQLGRAQEEAEKMRKALVEVSGIAAGSGTVNSLPHIARIARAALPRS